MKNFSRVLREIFVNLCYVPEVVIYVSFSRCSILRQFSIMTPRLKADDLGAMN